MTEQDRSLFIGGSDIPAIMGLSPWKTPLDIFREKVLGISTFDPDKQKIFLRGKRLEPIVIDMLIEEQGITVTKRSTPEKPNRYVHPNYPFIAAEIDFEWHDGTNTQNGEVKTVHPFQQKQWGEADTDEIPVYYAAQAMFGLGVTDRDHCKFACLFGADNLVTYDVHRDDETIGSMIEIADKFWHENILGKQPPAPQNVADVVKLFERDNGGIIEASPEIANVYAHLREIKNTIKAHEEEQVRLEFQIKEYISPNSILNIGGRAAATWKVQNQQRFDQERFRAEQPSLFNEFMKTISFRVLRLKN